jgi:hypothetical protein
MSKTTTSVPVSGLRFSASPFAHLKAKKEEPPDPLDDDENDDEATKAKKAKKRARRAEDADDENDEQKPETRALRERERSRIRAIVNSEAGLANPTAAMALALGTTTPRHRAIKLLGRMDVPAAANPRADALRDRMAGTANPDIGVSATQSSATLAQEIIAAGRKRRGEV